MTLTYDPDTNPEKRKLMPQFYGIVPDTGRMRTMALMMAISACQIAGRSLSLALLIAVSADYALAYYTAMISLFLAWKIARRDFLYCCSLKGTLLYFGSLLFRVIVIVSMDFAGTMQARIPRRLGASTSSSTRCKARPAFSSSRMSTARALKRHLGPSRRRRCGLSSPC